MPKAAATTKSPYVFVARKGKLVRQTEAKSSTAPKRPWKIDDPALTTVLAEAFREAVAAAKRPNRSAAGRARRG